MGDVFRRLVARTLAKEWAQVFDAATRPYQFALQAGAGTNALAASVRAALSLRPRSVLVSLDGRSAYDSMSRAAFLSKLREVAPLRAALLRPALQLLLVGRHKGMSDREGCEQRDALAPALFALGQHEALCRAAAELHSVCL